MSEQEFEFTEDDINEEELASQEKKGRKRLLLLLLLLLFLLCGVSGLAYQYIRRPVPLPELVLPDGTINYPPHYLFSIYGVEKPVGVTASPSGDRIYVTESGGDRLVRVFGRNGEVVGDFAPPGTTPGERSLVYLAMDDFGRLFVTDRLQHAIHVFDSAGNYLDALIGPGTALSDYVDQHIGGLEPGTTFAFNVYAGNVVYENPGQGEQILPVPPGEGWSPLGVRIDPSGIVYVTDVTKDANRIREFIIPQDVNMMAWYALNATAPEYGDSGQGVGEFMFPNAATSDSSGRVYVSDGNNGRVSVWDEGGNFLFNFADGSGEVGVSLPRGIFIDQADRLYVVDAVGQNVKVYDVSGPEPEFLHAFGDWGAEDGLFNYPNDIYVDEGGRLYIVDRENDRVQVWSY
jgi:DNA-binding beta-propeller fold protein YncE